MMKKVLPICALVALVAAITLPRLGQEDNRFGGSRLESESLLADHDPDELRSEIQSFCTRCHAFPEPSLYPASRWPAEIDRAMNFHKESGDDDPSVDSKVIVAWFKSQAEPCPPLTTPVEIDQNLFDEPIAGPDFEHAAAISSVLPVVEGDTNFIVSTDMISGKIQRTNLKTSEQSTLAVLQYPSRIRPCDLDPSCDDEFLVSELGTPTVTDDLVGRVVWLRKKSPSAKFETTVLASDLGRVSDVCSADLDGDGDEDVVVAEFGWDQTGSVRVLENKDGKFVQHQIDGRHGAVEIRVTDFDGDDRLDFVIAFGQEYESIEVFRNLGGFDFEATELFSASTPAFGMSSLVVFDNDGDGDMDVLFSSGDMYDSFFPQDHHGVYLLTNNGDDEYPVTLVGYQTAVMSTRVGDVDGDGDLDIVAGSFIPTDATKYAAAKGYPGLVVYKQVRAGEYEACPLKAGDCVHAAIELTDVNGDGALDLVAGTLHDVGGPAEPGIQWWPNKAPTSQETALR